MPGALRSIQKGVLGCLEVSTGHVGKGETDIGLGLGQAQEEVRSLERPNFLLLSIPPLRAT